jgi:heat-inducible transcriptional repressor
MEDALSARQTSLLKIIIDEHLETAEPVGSVALESKYNIGVSPATIRNEMAALTNKGYLKQPHTSAGRVPTPKGMKFYINQLMDEKKLSVTDEVHAKEEVWDSRDDIDHLLKDATQALAEQTNYLAVSTIDSGNTWSAGHSNLYNNPEFYSYQVCQSLFQVLEQQKRINELFFGHFTGMSPIEVLFGEELGWDFFEPIGMVATRFKIGDKVGAIGVVGPVRLNYPRVIPTVRYFGNLIQELSANA